MLLAWTMRQWSRRELVPGVGGGFDLGRLVCRGGTWVAEVFDPEADDELVAAVDLIDGELRTAFRSAFAAASPVSSADLPPATTEPPPESP